MGPRSKDGFSLASTGMHHLRALDHPRTSVSLPSRFISTDKLKQGVDMRWQGLTVFSTRESGKGVTTSPTIVLCSRPPYASGLSTR